ncbi:MAG: NAD(P)H-hydrate dehydratase [Acidobacteria bacterium]|nr:NAD(P)H-hydrate dehydratase [Acidobacteriota bacterium]
MKIVTAAEMGEIDRLTTVKYGIAAQTLMESAGECVSRFILSFFSGRQRITVVCGKGNNGGDGMVAARRLHEQGKDVVVVLLGRPEETKGDAKHNLERLPFPPVSVLSELELELHKSLLLNTDLIVDAIFGTGFRPPLPPLAATFIGLIANSDVPVVSADLPSGVDADSLTVEQPGACRSDAIVTFTALKPSLVFTALTRGPIVVHAIGSPEEIVQSKLGLEWNSPPNILRSQRPLNSHKGLYGHALVIGGSLGKSGAPSMSSLAALRVGAGLVTCAAPKSILPIIAGYAPELMTEALDESQGGTLSVDALEEPMAKGLLAGKTVVGIGPGLGHDEDTQRAIRRFAARCEVPLVIDADGLNAFAGQAKLLDGSKRPLVLTPHPGEMSRLSGLKVAEIEANRVEIARRFAQEHQVILVLKGWRTLIADQAGTVWVNTTGNPGLAKGGSGDVLTGLVTGLIAQFPDSVLEAVRAAVYLHGLAADLTLQTQTERTMLATDILLALPDALRAIRKYEDFTWIQRGETDR